jgi:hypothetical protein
MYQRVFRPVGIEGYHNPTRRWAQRDNVRKGLAPKGDTRNRHDNRFDALTRQIRLDFTLSNPNGCIFNGARNRPSNVAMSVAPGSSWPVAAAKPSVLSLFARVIRPYAKAANPPVRCQAWNEKTGLPGECPIRKPGVAGRSIEARDSHEGIWVSCGNLTSSSCAPLQWQASVASSSDLFLREPTTKEANEMALAEGNNALQTTVSPISLLDRRDGASG